MSENKEKETIYVVMVLARQIQGEYCFQRAEGAFRTASQADALIKKLAQQYVDHQGKPKAVEISTPQGSAFCYCEVGGFVLDLE